MLETSPRLETSIVDNSVNIAAKTYSSYIYTI